MIIDAVELEDVDKVAVFRRSGCEALGDSDVSMAAGTADLALLRKCMLLLLCFLGEMG